MKCPNCQKVVKQTPGKREKVFCNSTCRSNFWAKEKRKADATGKTVVFAKPTPKAFNGKKLPISIKDEPGKFAMPKGLSLVDQIDWKIKNKK